ncbi:MAG: LPS export ABC transporter permease LptG [Gammaproteobacteria bacterium]|nr:LPS export ABC transporter permease LptG [Gammaproteobacteria bacterium]MDE2348376.1 LPS export ABC transporter permease LptG [Gammaproteobacteria bacterium]
MNTLDRYLYRTVILYTLMAMAVLLTLGGLFLFISEQGDIGVGTYSAADAVLYTLLNLPQQSFELLPIGAMIGALMGLGNLAAASELVVTRASGISIWRVAWPVGLAGATIALAMYLIGEYAAPPLSQFAQTEKTTSRLADVSFAGRGSAWIKEGSLILRLRTGEVGQAFGGASLFVLDGSSRLKSIQTAERISVADPGRWMLQNVRTTTFSAGRVTGTYADRVAIRSTINPDFLGLAATDPDLLTLRGLAGYIDHLRRNHLQTALFEIGFWSRIARIFAVVIVTLLALPFVFGPLRTTGAGTRTVVGVLLGVVFFLITRTVENGGQLFGLEPVVVGWLPTAVIGLGTIIAISRTR